MVYGAVRIGADIIGAAVFSISISIVALATTFVRLFADFTRMQAWRPYNRAFRERTRSHMPVERRSTVIMPRNRRNCLPGLRKALAVHPAGNREVLLDSYYTVCTELALPGNRHSTGTVLAKERLFTGYHPENGRMRFVDCRTKMVRQPAIQVL